MNLKLCLPLSLKQGLESASIKESLLFFHVSELKDLALKLSLTEKGTKMTLIMRILHFLETGQKLTLPKFPTSSCAKRGQNYPLGEKELMLKGAYKNDLKTRLFFKQFIGEYFHFTAFGIDWLNERWMKGNPPTYQEFSKMWQTEYQKRKEAPAAPKKEWAYIRFVQKFLLSSPTARRENIYQAWESERQKHKTHVYEFLT